MYIEIRINFTNSTSAQLITGGEELLEYYYTLEFEENQGAYLTSYKEKGGDKMFSSTRGTVLKPFFI